MNERPVSSLESPAPDGTVTLARNVASRYLAIGVETGLGLLMLPFNVAHLGQAGYGLWMLTASVTAYFSILDLGYAGSVVRFVAHYRARREVGALNEVLSTTAAVFVALGIVAYGVGVAAAFGLGHLFALSPDELATGRTVLLILAVNVAGGLAFSVFGGVVNGFQRYDLNNLVGTATSIVAAIVNVIVLWSGYGLVTLVSATTAVRLIGYALYRMNAYRVFPELHLSWALVSRARLRELTGFSLYMSISDWAAKLNYSVDALVVGAFMGPAAVAVWSVAQRITDAVMRLTNQLNDMMFPAIVDHASSRRTDRLAVILIEATRLSLAAALPVGVGVGVLAEPLIAAWVGPTFHQSVLVLQLLMVTVVVRVAVATAITLLRGAGHHKLVALTNAGAAVANLALSVTLVRFLSYAGVAIGTIVPIAVAGLFIVFPTACRRVGVPVAMAVRLAILPPLWPGILLAGALLAVRARVGGSLVGVVGLLGAGVVGYLLLFVFVALDADERSRYLARWHALRSRARLQPVAEGA